MSAPAPKRRRSCPAGGVRKKLVCQPRAKSRTLTGRREDFAPDPGDAPIDAQIKLLLAKLSVKDVQNLKLILKLLSKHGVLTSLCSGSGIGTYALSQLCALLGISMAKELIICELEERKAKWLAGIHKVVYKGSTQHPCVFKRAEDMCSTSAYCHTHRRSCPVPVFNQDVLNMFNFTGFSCKNLSKLFNGDSLTNPGSSWIAQRSGSTGETFDAFIKFLAHTSCLMALCENVTELLAPKHFSAFVQACNEHGFAVTTWVVDCSDYSVLSLEGRVT